MEITNDCIREHCACWLKSCKKIEDHAMRYAEKQGFDPESERISVCKWAHPGQSQEPEDLSFLPSYMR